LHDAIALLRCPRCGQADWVSRDDLVSCIQCGVAFPVADGVLDLTGAGDEPSIVREQDAAHQTERDPGLGGINERFSDLAAADGPLKSAILALPDGDGSKYYREAGYFANVRTSVAAFDFLLRHLSPKAGERLLDLGADLTWSTSHLARRGLRCIAVDINHHLAVARLFFDRYRISYGLVRADMSRVSFRDDAFDVVLAINALHHCADLDTVAANIARMLRPGGRLAFIEPYCGSAEDRLHFGAAQIEAGISEHTYLLREWHAAFAKAGLAIRVHRASDSFAAVYQKAGVDRAGDPDLFDGFYTGELSVATPAVDGSGGTLTVGITIRNHGNGVWCERSLFPVRASYHLYRIEGGGKTLTSFDNLRTPLGFEVGPGGELTIPLQIARPGEPGAYVAEVDLVHEGMRWFSERGVGVVPIAFTVTAT
jgi:SAM-dependent methyltransferase